MWHHCQDVKELGLVLTFQSLLDDELHLLKRALQSGKFLILITFGGSFWLSWLRMKVSFQLNRIIDQVLEHLVFLGTVLSIIRYSDKQDNLCLHVVYITVPHGLIHWSTRFLIYSVVGNVVSVQWKDKLITNNTEIVFIFIQFIYWWMPQTQCLYISGELIISQGSNIAHFRFRIPKVNVHLFNFVFFPPPRIISMEAAKPSL